MILGFTGTQGGMTGPQLVSVMAFLVKYQVDELHHGDCIGSDWQMHLLATTRRSVALMIHPPDNPAKRARCTGAFRTYPHKPYLERNHDIVDACDVLLATPRTHDEELRSGTWATIRYARKCGKPICIVDPDGSCRLENWSPPDTNR